MDDNYNSSSSGSRPCSRGSRKHEIVGQHQSRIAIVAALPQISAQNELSPAPTTPQRSQYRSVSLTGPGATHLSQCIRERLSNGSLSLPKHSNDLQHFQQRISNRCKAFEGSLSDSQTYADIKPDYTSSYGIWLKSQNCNAAESLDSVQTNSPGMKRHRHKIINRNGETNFIPSPKLNRSNSIRSTKSEKNYSSILSRGFDVENEPYYCLPVGAIQQRPSAQNGGIRVAWSQPTSPTPLHNRLISGTMSGTIVSPSHDGFHPCNRLHYPKINNEAHGSEASLVSGASSIFSSTDERQLHEMQRLKRELADAKDQVMSLSCQLSTNAHVVSAFEQSLSNMTTRLQQLTATAERKDGELTDMRQTIELLRKQSIQAGLTTAHMQSMGVQQQQQSPPPPPPNLTNSQQIFNDCGDNIATGNRKPIHFNQMNSHHQTYNNGVTTNLDSRRGPGAFNQTFISNNQHQQYCGSESMNSLNTISSNYSVQQQQQQQQKKKKKGWLSSSFSKAFSRNNGKMSTNRNGTSNNNNISTENLHQNHHIKSTDINTDESYSPPTNNIQIFDNNRKLEGNPVVEDLKKQLREKDLVLTDIRLEALSSASQLESLKDTVMRMRAEMFSLKQNNDRLQKLVTCRSLAGSDLSLAFPMTPSAGDSRRCSLVDNKVRPFGGDMNSGDFNQSIEQENIEPPAPAPDQPPHHSMPPPMHIELTPPPPAIEPISPSYLSSPAASENLQHQFDGKKISISVYLGQPESFQKYLDDISKAELFFSRSPKTMFDENRTEADTETRDDQMFVSPAFNEFVVANIYISGKTSWQNLDCIVRKTFKDYLARIDPGTNLGLNTDSITSYHLGEAKRGPEIGFPELLPCGYIVGNVKNLYICLQGVGSLAFDSLIPRSIVHRYISLLQEHRRLILCGPSGTGKSYLARKLAEFLIARSGRANNSKAIACFNVDQKSSNELRQYLSQITEQFALPSQASELPSVIILDNLHHASALGDVFQGLCKAGPAATLPCIIGTMSQATCNTTNLQLHHNFRWVLTANHMEPVKGFLGRFLRRRVYTLELQTQNNQNELSAVLAWLSTVWQHINRFLENHSSSDVTIGPRLFLSCPLDLKDSQVWFTDIWNFHLSPYIIDTVREGVQLYGRRGGVWCDPSIFIRDTYPWLFGPDSVPPLRQITADDVGLEGAATTKSDSQDPLLNMLMRLQEAANYTENQEHESDCASIDSNGTPDSSAGVEN